MVDPITAAIAWIGAELGGTIGATLIMNAGAIASFTAFTATIAGSAAMQRRAKAKARAAYNASLKDRELTFRSAIAPRRVIYGRDRVGGVMVYAQATGPKKEFLHVVLALTAHECDAIEEIWFGDVKLPDPDGDGWINSGPFGQAPVQRGTQDFSLSGVGTVTLSRPAIRVTDVTSAPTSFDANDAASYTFTHVPGSAVVSGLPLGRTITIGYEYATEVRKVRIRKHLGGAGQVADADLVAESGGAWTSAHKGTGICYLYMRLEYDQEMFASFDLSRVMCVVRGKKVLDPRTGAAAWTDNAELVSADWLRDQTFGMRATADQVPSSEVIAGANICDEVISISGDGGTQRRYTFNGSFTTDQAPRDVLEDLLACMAGTCVWAQGRWLLRPGAYRTPEAGAEITADHLAEGGVVVTPKASRSALYNGVRATYRDPAQGWAEVQAPVVTNATYVAQDGGTPVVRTITLPGAMDSLRAQRLAKIELERGRQAVTVQASTNLRAYNYAPTDTCLLFMPRYGWGSGKVFEVVDRTWSADGTLRYTWRETAAEVYAWSLGEATIGDPAPDTDLPSPYTKPAALGTPSVASGTAQLWRQADGTITSRAHVEWPASVDQFVIEGGRIELQWSVGGGSEEWQDSPPLPGTTTDAWIAPVPDGQVLVVRVRQVNPLGVRSLWSYATVIVVGKTALPADVSGLTVAATPGGVKVAWSTSAELDYAETEVRYGSSWAAGTTIFRGAAQSFVWPWPAAGTYTVRARNRDTSGNESATDAAASITVGPASLIGPTEIKVGGITVTDMAESAGPYTGIAAAAVVTLTPPVPCDALVTVEMNFSCTNSTGAAALIYGAFNVGFDDGSGLSAVADRYVSQTLAVGDSVRFPVTITYRFDALSAGVAHQFSAIYSDHGSSVLSGTVSNLRTRVELILR